MPAAKIMGRLLAPLLVFSGTLSAIAEEGPALGLPIECVLGETCHIQQYVDRAPGPERRDFACGDLANDAHKGTDFAVPELADVRTGVSVLAAAAGRVRGLRDGLPDLSPDSPGAPDVSGRECGNGVVLEHGDGWETQYCHLKRDSVAVRMGQRVERGEKLGLVGMSGLATFPHVHFALRHEGRVIDPFTPDMSVACHDDPGEALWIDPVAYRPGGLISYGVIDRVPDYTEIQSGLSTVALPAHAPAALVLWGHVFAGKTGDIIELTLTGPDGQIGQHPAVLERDQPTVFRAWGKRAPSGGFPAGTYTGNVRHLREGQTLDERVLTFNLP